MFCRNCGKDLQDSAESCNLCGHLTGVPEKRNSTSHGQLHNHSSYAAQSTPEYSAAPYIPPPEPRYNSLPYNENYQASYNQQMDGGLAALLYIISFLLPLAGFIIGAIYVSKDEEHFRQVGRTCLMLGLLSILFSFFFGLFLFIVVMESF
jgi:hypothetical protein